MTNCPSETNAIPAQLAKNYLAAGLCVLPAVLAQKRPALAGWRTYQGRLPTEKEVEAWFANRHEALCIVAGQVSSGIECIDFDAGGECFEPWTELVPPELFGRLVVEQTPSGGFHVVYRCEETECNQKLAEGLRNEKLATLIETRADGGLFLCAPTPGYRLVQGAFGSVPTITPEERSVLLGAARSLDERQGERQSLIQPPRTHTPATSSFDERPGDAFNADEAGFYALLERHGWKYLGKSGDNENWQRPGKTGNGLSATWNGTTFFVFSSNVEGLEAGKGYSPFTVYAALAFDVAYNRRQIIVDGHNHSLLLMSKNRTTSR